LNRDELETLSSKELHDRAVSVARRRMDLGFLWDLVRYVPAAEAAAGNLRAAEIDVASLSSLLGDVAHSGEGEVAENLRPLYIEYLEKHG
jgi:hypothetical protein